MFEIVNFDIDFVLKKAVIANYSDAAITCTK